MGNKDNKNNGAKRSQRSAGGGADARAAQKLGTFLGVFTPTLLTILGVIMYLRFGWMVGHVGLFYSLVIVVIANAITITTALSLSAIATNTRIGVGGAYFMISRSLGLEIGGAIGLPLFLSQVFSVTLYAFGLAESFRYVWPAIPLEPTVFCIIVLVGALSYRGASIALRAQVPVMALVGISIVALVVGAITHPAEAAVPAEPQPAIGFWVVFAVFFPAVTGIMAGLGLSGDLEDPRKSIPLGSISACATAFVVYLVVVVMLAQGATPELLRDDQLVWARIAPWGAILILPGLWGAIFSSAVGSMLGAPRTLQAMAADHTRVGSFLHRLASPGRDEPLAGIIVCLILALGAVFLGDLNAVAEVVSMFFLTVYGTVNLVAAAETLSGDPTWRPRIRVPWMASFAGAIACFAVMFLINAVASIAAISVELGLWLFFRRMEMRSEHGDMRRDIYEAFIRWALIRLYKRPMTARNWRPHVLIFSENIEKRLNLVRFGNWFSQDRGVVTVCELLIGDILDENHNPPERRNQIDQTLKRHGIVAFPQVGIVPSVQRGILDVVQSNGMAGFQSNTVLLGWPGDTERLAGFLKMLRPLEKLNKSVVIGRPRQATAARQGKRRVIDIWWGGLERNGDLMLLLAHLLSRNAQWRGAKIRILSVASNDLTKAETESKLQKLLPEARIDAETRVIVKPKDAAIRGIITAESQDVDTVFLGLATPAEGEEEAYAARMQETIEDLPTAFFVKNASLFVGGLV